MLLTDAITIAISSRPGFFTNLNRAINLSTTVNKANTVKMKPVTTTVVALEAPDMICWKSQWVFRVVTRPAPDFKPQVFSLSFLQIVGSGSDDIFDLRGLSQSQSFTHSVVVVGPSDVHALLKWTGGRDTGEVENEDSGMRRDLPYAGHLRSRIKNRCTTRTLIAANVPPPFPATSYLRTSTFRPPRLTHRYFYLPT